MFLNHLKIGVRSLLRDHVYSILNVAGLAIGITATVLLSSWVRDELSFDKFHAKSENIYRVNAHFDNSGNKVTWTGTPGPLVPFSKRIPSVREAGRIAGGDGALLVTFEGKSFVEDHNSAYVDPNFFTVFDFPFVQGDPTKPFADNKSIVISERIAKKYFGDAAPLGKTIRFENKDDYRVGGVMRNIPENSTIRYDILIPFDVLIKRYEGNEYWKSLETDWGNYFYFTYLLLDPTASPTQVASEMTKIHRANQAGTSVDYSLQPLTSLHLYNADMKEDGIQTVRIFLIIAVAILFIACINYVNLTTARATKRAKEVGVRKTVGATRSKLIAQFLTESALISIIALVVALVLIQLVTPIYNDISGKTISLTLLNSQNLILIGSTLCVTALAAGIYPALVLSSFRPLQVLRGKLVISGSNSIFRNILVVTQFSLSIVIVVGTLVINQQLKFMRNKKLGFDKENIFSFGLRGEMFKNIQPIKSELAKNAGIEMATMSNQHILSLDGTTGDTDFEGKAANQVFMVHPASVDEHFIKALNFEIIEGRGFTGAKSDTAGYILNETAVKQAGLVDPIGKSFTLWQIKGKIIGVVKDFHHASMRSKIEPIVLFYNPNWLWLVYVKTNGKDNAAAVAAAEKIWKQYNPAYPFEFRFLDDQYDLMYKSEQRMGNLFAYFSVVAILISCLGLFGLSTFTASQRVKEIGIRKVMGASAGGVVFLLSRNLLSLVLISLLIAVPIAYMGAQTWLQDFIFRVEIDWTIFLVAGAIAFCIAFFTISFQTIRAALGNPVDSLRNE